MAFATHSTTSPSISAIVIARDEEAMIVNCLDALRWADERIVLDTGSTDHTAALAERAGATVFTAKGQTFAQWRNEAAAHANHPWILYIDADERVTPALAKSIRSRIRRDEFDAFTLRRNNIHLGRWMQHGGWEHDVLIRLMKKNQLVQWVGDVHEHAEIRGRLGAIEEPLVHLTHRQLYDGLRKSVEWTDVEARLLLRAKHPRITPLRLLKIVAFDFLDRLIVKRSWKDGEEGIIEAMIQTMNRFLVYTRLWELQQKPSLADRYDRIEAAIQKQWRDEA